MPNSSVLDLPPEGQVQMPTARCARGMRYLLAVRKYVLDAFEVRCESWVPDEALQFTKTVNN